MPGRYNRDTFGGWSNDDGDCQNTRHELLIARSLAPVEYTDDGCLAVSGHWHDPYTGETFTSAARLDIDHVVPLFYAWERGAAFLEPEKQRQFANDPANPMPVDGAANRAKGAAGPAEWLPPAEEFGCGYVLRFARVIDRYDLRLPADEAEDVGRLTAEMCD